MSECLVMMVFEDDVVFNNALLNSRFCIFPHSHLIRALFTDIWGESLARNQPTNQQRYVVILHECLTTCLIHVQREKNLPYMVFTPHSWYAMNEINVNQHVVQCSHLALWDKNYITPSYKCYFYTNSFLSQALISTSYKWLFRCCFDHFSFILKHETFCWQKFLIIHTYSGFSRIWSTTYKMCYC